MRQLRSAKWTMGTQNNLDHFSFRTGAVFEPDRFERPDLGITLEPSFTIRPGNRVFAMGSCFAQRIMEAMRLAGFPSTDAGLDLKYNAMAMLQETRWSLRGGFDQSYVARTTDGRWFNGHRHPARPKASLEEALLPQISAQRTAGKAIQSADVIVLTFGLVEAWRDKAKDVWLNETPPCSVVSFPERFSVHQLTHAQCREAMISLVREVQAVNPSAKFVCSVSPVPLKATFFGNDVLVSNMHSKSTQRSALAEAIDSLRASGGPQIDYFPSYELTMLAPRRDDVWERHLPDGRPDGRHVRPDFVHRAILPLFLKTYVPSGESGRSYLPGQASQLAAEHSQLTK
jgi:hypothetical protein